MKHFIRVISHWGLLLHIYVSMAGFSLVLLFAVTGLTLNHQDFGWGEPELTTSQIELPKELMMPGNREGLNVQCMSYAIRTSRGRRTTT